MAFMCYRTSGKECDGCGGCVESGDEAVIDCRRLVRCEECGGNAVEDGYYYNIEGTVLCGSCVDKLYKKDVLSI